jgi:hypothetical protein
MTSDYDRICRDNLEEYGKGTRHLSFLERLYSERTHFIFELLQNAEDAGATRVKFDLKSDRLEVWHDGSRLFDEKDVRGVCGIGEGTKENDLTQIGKFGIGFKSVYAFTVRPEIHCDDEHFAIEKYIRPQKAKPVTIPSPWTTLFILPFNRPDVLSVVACVEITLRLANLNSRTLLFLRNIQEIEWASGSSSGCYVRQQEPCGSARRVTVIGQTAQKEDETTWLVFEAPVKNEASPLPLRVEAAFRIEPDEETGEESVVAVERAELSVFFSTEKLTGLRFVIQGPYRTTPARDNIPKDDTWNKQLVVATAGLVAATLGHLREMDLLSVGALQTLPLRQADFLADSMFRPIFDSVAQALRTRPLLPTDSGDFVTAAQARISRGGDLRKLFPANILSALLGTATPLQWVTADITEVRTPDLYQYCRQVLQIEEITPESVIRQLTKTFLEGRSDEWLTEFYEFLSPQEALWRKSRWGNDPPGLARAVPIIRLEDGTHVLPFKNDGSPAAYFKAPFEVEGVPFIRRGIASHEESRKFLQKLGFSEFDMLALVRTLLLSKYQSGGRVTEAQNLEDVRLIGQVLEATKNDEQRRAILAAVRETALVWAVSTATHPARYVKPGDAYFQSDELVVYFKGNPNAWLLSTRYSKELEGMLEELGVSCTIRVYRPDRTPDWQGYVKLDSAYRRGANGFDPSVQVDGLAYAVGHPNIDRSRYVWNNIAVRNARDVRGTVEDSNRKDFSYSRSSIVYSEMGKPLVNSAWLPSGASFLKPSQITLDGLPADFERDATLATQLGMKVNEIAELAQKIGIEMEAITLAQQIVGNQDLLDKVRQLLQANTTKPEFPSRPTPNPARRSERVAHDAATAPDKTYEVKSRSVRTSEPAQDPGTWLREAYTNSSGQMVCQICKEVMPFKKRDGQYYFESVESLDTLPQEHHALFLALCPVCAAKYKEFVRRDPAALERFQSALVAESQPIIAVTLSGEDATVTFVDSHFLDLQTILRGD